MNLQEFIPLPVLDFKSRYWRSACLVSEGPPDRFNRLLDTKRFFALCRAGRAFDVVSGGIHSPVISARPERYARQGLPLVLMDVQNKAAEVADLLANLMMDLMHCGQGHVNAYYNPRAGKGLGAHKDAEDLLILQLEGTKHWQVADPPGSRRRSARVFSFALNPGDAMYLPFEAPHRAESRSGATLHLTFGFYPKSMGDFLSDTIRLYAERFSFFQTALPPVFSLAESQKGLSRLKGAAETFAESVPEPGFWQRSRTRQVWDAIERSVKNPAWPPAAGAAPPRRPLAPSDRLRWLASGVLCEDKGTLGFYSARLRRHKIPKAWEAQFRRLLRRPFFSVEEALLRKNGFDRAQIERILTHCVAQGLLSCDPDLTTG